MTTTMTMMYRSLLLFGLATLPGCPLLEVEAEVPEVCLTYPNLQIESPAVSSATQSFVFDDLSAIRDLAEQDASLGFVRAELRVTSGLDNLAFVDAVKFVVSSGDAGTTLPPLTIYSCDGDCVPDGNALELTAAEAHNAIDYLRSNSIKIDMEFHGEIPAASWTLDVDVCMKGKASYTVSP